METNGFLLRECREKIDALDKAERQYVAMGNWQKATECANARLAEQTRMHLLMRYDKQEVF